MCQPLPARLGSLDLARAFYGVVPGNHHLFVYIILAGDVKARIKIGVAADPLSRLAQLQTGSGVKLRLLAVAHVQLRERAFELEKMMHSELAHWRLTGEWFKAVAYKEIKKIRANRPACSVFFRQCVHGQEARVTEMVRSMMKT